MAANPTSAKMLLPEPFNGTGDITAYITQFELLSDLQKWLAPVLNAEGVHQTNNAGVHLYTDTRHQIFPLRLRAGAIEFYHSLEDDIKNDYKKLRVAFQKQYQEPPEFFRGALRKRTQGESEKVTEYLADLKLLAKKAYLDDSDEIRTHLVMQAFLEGLFDQNVRLELRKEKHTDLDAALQRAVYLEAIYRLEQQDTPGVSSKSINNSHAGASIDTLLTRVDSMMNKLNVSQINSESGRASRGMSRYSRSSFRSKSPRQGTSSRNYSTSRERFHNSRSPRYSGKSSTSTRLNSLSRSPRRPTPVSSRSPSVDRKVRFDRDLVCYGCNRKGHTKDNCRNCWSCGSTSHTRRNCPHNSRR